MRTRLLLLGPVLGLMAAQGPARAADSAVYQEDVRFALDAIEKECGHFFELKRIDWRQVRKEFLDEAKEVESDQDHLVLLVRLLARLKDGHAAVYPTDKTRGVKLPDQKEKTGPGMFWCRLANRIYVKNSWGAAKDERIEPGMEVVEVNGEPVIDWLKKRIVELSGTQGFSTPHQAFFHVTHWGLAEEPGTEMKLKMRTVGGGSASRSLKFAAGTSYLPDGPAYFPEDLEHTSDLKFGYTKKKWGYIHVRRCKSDLIEQIDVALAKVGDAPGLILDFRGNSGGGMDHEAFMGRFIPKGESMSFAGKYESAGERPYGGPIVVIVDATVRSTGETASGIFKEDGRGYMIGESSTAGMSSSKKTLELPSGLFSLYVSVYSNKKRFQNGEGIEGIGVRPHEEVAFDPKDLAAGVDTLIKVAEERLEKFPQDKVPYQAKR